MKIIQMYVMLFSGLAVHTQGQGTIQFMNGAGSRVTTCVDGRIAPLPAFSPVVFGAFYGTVDTPEAFLIQAPGLATIGAVAGILVVNNPNAFPLPESAPNQLVSLQIRGWHSAFGDDWRAARASGAYFGTTDVRQVTLGPSIGPGTVIWQSASGLSPNKFYSMYVGPLTCIPEPSMLPIGLLVGVVLLLGNRKSWKG